MQLNRYVVAVMFLAICSPVLLFGQVEFIDMAQDLGVTDRGHTRGVGAVDIDNDGTSEIIIVNKYGDNCLYKWNGISYDDLAQEYGIDYSVEHHNLNVVDFNKDGFPDIYIVSHPFLPDARFYRNDGHPPFQEISNNINLNSVDDMGTCFFQLNPYSEIAAVCGDKLYIKRGGQFEDISDLAGFGEVPALNGIQPCDIDGDNDDDLFFTSYWSNVGKLYRNNGDSTFTDISSNNNMGRFPAATGASFGDIDNDGDFDLFVVNSSRTTMWQNDGTGYFTEITGYSYLDFGGYTRGSSFGDFDNDGDLDLFLNRAYDSNLLLINDGSGVFTDITYNAGVVDSLNGVACAVSDFNNDGQLDIVATNCDYQPVQLYINQNSNNSFIKVKLMANPPNTLALGGIIKLFGVSDDKIDTTYLGMREVTSLSSYHSVNDLVQHFGTGDYTNLIVEAVFPSLQRVVIDGVTPGETVTIFEYMTEVDDDVQVELPENFVIMEAYPNPFNSSTNISLAGGHSESYELYIYDMLGRLVKSESLGRAQLVDGNYTWNGTDNDGESMTSGVYFAKIIGERETAEIKMTLLK